MIHASIFVRVFSIVPTILYKFVEIFEIYLKFKTFGLSIRTTKKTGNSLEELSSEVKVGGNEFQSDKLIEKLNFW